MRSGLFAYGTLSLPAVFGALLGRPAPGVPAALEGWARYRVRGALYPALVLQRGARTEGLLYPPLTPAEQTLVDRFEGLLYVRRPLEVSSAEGRSLAQVYLLAPGRESALTDEPWDADAFAAHHLERYRSACRRFRRSQAAAAP